MPEVSIITPCYNSEKYVRQTIESVQAQTFSDWEHIIVDDGSQDASALVVEPYTHSDPRIKLIRQKNGGVSNARNNGLKGCSTDSKYLYFLDADDCLEINMLTAMLKYMEIHNSVGMAYCGHCYINDKDQIVETHKKLWRTRYTSTCLSIRRIPPEEAKTPFHSIFSQAWIVPSLSVIRRSIYDLTPGWDENFGQLCEDTDMFLHIALHSNVHFVPETLVRYRRHDQQSTADSGKLERQRKKLDTKWLKGGGLTNKQKAIVKEAWQFREGRLLPIKSLSTGNRHLRRGRISTAGRVYAEAAKRYFASFLPGFSPL